MQIKEYLSNAHAANKLYNSYIIRTDDAHLAMKEVKAFLQDLLAAGDLSYSQDLLIVQKDEGNVKNIPVDKVREVGRFLNKTSIMSGKKVAVIFCAEQMNANAANACLKVLEDTPPNSYLFLITENIFSILSTVLSRCSKINHFYYNQQKTSSNESFYLNLLSRTAPLPDRLAFIKSFGSKNRESWLDFAEFVENLVGKFCKKASMLQVELSFEEEKIYSSLKSRSLPYLYDKFEDICKLNRDVINLDLELQSSCILLLEHFH